MRDQEAQELTTSGKGSNLPVLEAKLKKLETNRENDGYVLTFSNANINVAVFGCDGTGNKHQQANADAVKKKVEDKEVDFVIHLGDAVYRPNGDGASKYSHLENQLIKVHKETKVPFFMVKGNHEENIQRHPLSKGYKAGLRNYQKVHHFFQGKNFGENTPPKITIGTEEKNKFNTRPKENEAYYTISCKAQNQNEPEIEYIVIDSNTLPYDNNQKEWLRKKIQNSIAKNIFICCHHPILTYDKRLFARNDSKYYRNRMLAREKINKKPAQKSGKNERKPANPEQEDSTILSSTNLGASIQTPEEPKEKNIRAEEKFYRRAYGLSHNRILKGVFRDEIIGKIQDGEANENVKRLRGFITAHNHSQGTIRSKKNYKTVFIQGAAGKKIDPPKHKDGFDVKNKMFYNNKENTGFGIVKITDQTLTVESHTIKKGCSEISAQSTSNPNTTENQWEHKNGDQKFSEITDPETEKSKAIKKLKALDKILRKFVQDNKKECEENKKSKKDNGKYAAITKYARYLHNRLGNEISLTKSDSKLTELGNIAQASAEFLIKITSTHQQSNAENTSDSTNSYQVIAKKYFGDNWTQPEDKVMLKHKHFYHSPSLRKTALLISIAIVATVINFLPFGTLINLIALGGFLIFSTSPSIYFSHHYHVCRASNQYRFFSEASKLVEKAVKTTATLTS